MSAMRFFYRRMLFILLLIFVGACNTPTAPAAPPTYAESATLPPTFTVSPASTFTIIPPTATIISDRSLRVPEILSAEIETVYVQAKRSRLDGRDTLFWPDGNIGFVPEGNQFRFFAANGTLTAVTLGSLDDPAATVIANRMSIHGAGTEFSYCAGGPIYRDPASGMLLMFYHAERHFGGDGRVFHAALGLAASRDAGKTFENLGIILETNIAPNRNAPCCIDMGGAPFVIKDGMFYVYFMDHMQDGSQVNLAVATAPVTDVVSAALEGKTSLWLKYYKAKQEPGISGKSSPLELGNPTTDWMSVSYNTALDQFIMVTSSHSADQSAYSINLAVSADGYVWSPRVLLTAAPHELTYPSIIGAEGDPLNTGGTFYVYYASSLTGGMKKWQAADLMRMKVTLSGNLKEAPRAWEFDTDAGGWQPQWQVGAFEVKDGTLRIESTGVDPYIHSSTLGLDGNYYRHIEIRMKVGKGGTGQFFFTNAQSSDFSEANSVRFPVQASDNFVVYAVDMSKVSAWKNLIGVLRLDPIDQQTTVEIDYIRLIP